MKDLTNKRFGILTAVKCLGRIKIGNYVGEHVCWLCKCDCGNDYINITSKISNKTSCGCTPRPIRSDIKHETNGMLTALDCTGKQHENGCYLWNVSCSCGNTVEYTTKQFKDNISCGCMSRSHGKNHGMSKSHEFRSWCSIKNAIFNENYKGYKHNGAKGLTMQLNWVNSFETFLEDVGRKPLDGKYKLNRIDKNDGYNKDNVRWNKVSE